MRRGVRMIDGREFLLAGRGERERVEREAISARQRWTHVRIVSAYPGPAKLVRLLDDWMLYVHGARQ